MKQFDTVILNHCCHFLPVIDRVCSLVVRAPGYRSRGPEFDSLRYQIF
jgi:hypothetical protein